MTIKDLENKIAQMEEQYKGLESMPEMEAAREAMLKTINAQKVRLNKEKKALERRELAPKRSNVDWTKHPSKLVRQAWADTVKVGESAISLGTSNNANVLQKGIDGGIIKNALLQGPTGTGKTTLMKIIGHALNRPVVSINFSGNMEESDVIGGMLLDDKGTTVWQDGPLITAMKEGLIFVAEEINFAKASVLGKFNSLMDDLRQVDLQSHDEAERIVKADESFIFAATMNPDYKGTQEFNVAFMNRWNIVMNVDKLSDKKLQQIILKKTGSDDEALVNSLILFKLIIERQIIKEDYEAAISVRQLINAVNMVEVGVDITSAIGMAITEQVSNGDLDLKKYIKDRTPGVKELYSRFSTGEKLSDKQLKAIFRAGGAEKEIKEVRDGE